MNVKEKLVELLTEFYGCDPMYYDVDALAIAQHLVAHGVTAQEWISVTDRLPDDYGLYLIVCGGKVQCAYREGFLFSEIWNDDLTGGFSIIPDSKVTHWMPLPEPPKGN